MADINEAMFLKSTAAYTDVNLSNNTDVFVKKGDTADIKDWYGSGERPTGVEAQSEEYFKHIVDTKSNGGSVGGNAYIYPDKFKWIFAWSTTGTKNTVYTAIRDVNYVINWDDILYKLRHSCTETASITEYGFTSTVTTDADSTTPNLTATLDEA